MYAGDYEVVRRTQFIKTIYGTNYPLYKTAGQ